MMRAPQAGRVVTTRMSRSSVACRRPALPLSPFRAPPLHGASQPPSALAMPLPPPSPRPRPHAGPPPHPRLIRLRRPPSCTCCRAAVLGAPILLPGRRRRRWRRGRRCRGTVPLGPRPSPNYSWPGSPCTPPASPGPCCDCPQPHPPHLHLQALYRTPEVRKNGLPQRKKGVQ
jgi:hypothetical protein